MRFTVNANGRYILDEHGDPQPEPDLLKWGKWLQNADRHVAQDYVGKVRVSTIFLALDQRFPPGENKPVLWETMIFDPDGGEHDCYQERYNSREDALAGHQKALELVHGGRKDRNHE